MARPAQGGHATAVPPIAVHLTTAVALVTAVVVALLVPLAHYYFGNRYHSGSLAEVAHVYGRQLSQMIGRNPQLWEFETVRFDDLLRGRTPEGMDERKRVTSARGGMVVSVGAETLAWPVVRAEAPLYDAGMEVGRLEIERSLRPLMVRSLGVFLLSGLLGCAVFLVLRTLPLRALRKAIARASFLASHDPLTGLPNRALFGEWLAHTVTDVSWSGMPAAVLCLDLDHFKETNDLLGHAAGDELLRQVAERMRGLIGVNDIMARLGGDEFAIIQNRTEQPAGSARLAERLIEVLSDPFDLCGSTATVGASIGICICEPGADMEGARLLQRADLALYRAKSEGRGNYQFFEEEMNQRLIERKAIEADLRQAIAREELELHYQPQVDLATGEVLGVEALLRWHHPERGWVGPDRFIQLAEETGLILPLGDWVIRTACRQALVWPNLNFAINVSPVQFRHGDLLDSVRAALAQTGIDPSRLELEITEGVLLNNTEDVLDILNGLKALGVRIAMDDFGTGYSSLSYLRRFPFDKIKIDRSFVLDLGNGDQAESIMDAVISLGRSLGMASNAEGVETLDQVEFLRDRGCKEVQGFYFARPMTGSALQATLTPSPEDGKLYLRTSGASDSARA